MFLLFLFLYSLQAELAAHKTQNILEDTTISNSNMSSSAWLKDKRPVYRHNQQLEELRNLQDKLTQEKECWIRERDTEIKDLEERREQLLKLQVSVIATFFFFGGGLITNNNILTEHRKKNSIL